VEIDDLEREDGTPTECVQEDPDLDDPKLARQAEAQPPAEQPAAMTVQVDFRASVTVTRPAATAAMPSRATALL
jgi:hypothetical protein